ncbi:hypothetical protein [Nocardia jinanensis]|uniref:Uncharacterized protein n=1 Tax=Nocardia jinanensis TaxID=382504 RepID=A0A917VLD7_9NOCA|nr:hypothetical protein [Nocardia jinanensis]GGK97037.1 hypothetical protein GCM10011588_09350 [Nocardia jinanensis]
MTQRVLPYRTASEGCVKAADWCLLIDGDEIPLPEAYPNWDYQTNLNLCRELRIDRSRVLKESGLAPDTELVVAALWTSTGSKLRGTLQRAVVPESGVIELSGTVVGSHLGGTVLLDTVLVLSRRRHGHDRPVAPRRAGSVMWSDRTQIRLQGDAPQFPIAIVDFVKTNYPETAAWHLEIGPGLDSATMGSLLLLVNEQYPMITEALQRAGKPTPQDRMALAMIHADVARIMVEYALRHPEFDGAADYLDETIGATLQELLVRLFPGRSLADIRLRAEQAPNVFASELQSAVKVFEGVV